MAILNQYLTLAKESTYGTRSTTNPVAYEVRNTDDWKPETTMVESGGRRAGKHTKRSDRTETVQKGGTGSVEVALLTEGMEALLANFLGGHGTTNPVVVAPATTPNTYTQLYLTDTDGPADSWSVTLGRSRADASALDQYAFTGAVVTGGELKVGIDDPVTLMVNYAWETQLTTPSAGAPSLTYPGGVAYTWSKVAGTLGGTSIPNLMSFSFSVDHAMATDRHYLRASSARAKPLRSGEPVYTGSVEMVYDDLSYATQGNWLAGTLTSLTLGATLGDTRFSLSLPSVRLDGDAPVSSLDDLTKITVPFTVLHNGSNPAATLTYVTTGDAYA